MSGDRDPPDSSSDTNPPFQIVSQFMSNSLTSLEQSPVTDKTGDDDGR